MTKASCKLVSRHWLETLTTEPVIRQTLTKRWQSKLGIYCPARGESKRTDGGRSVRESEWVEGPPIRSRVDSSGAPLVSRIERTWEDRRIKGPTLRTGDQRFWWNNQGHLKTGQTGLRSESEQGKTMYKGEVWRGPGLRVERTTMVEGQLLTNKLVEDALFSYITSSRTWDPVWRTQD